MQLYMISTYAGVPKQPGVDLPFFGLGIAADAAGNVYFSSSFYCVCIFKLDQNGVVTRIAGNSEPGYSGDGGPATSARLSPTGAVAADDAGNLFIADFYFFPGNGCGPRVRKVSPDGTITTVAGNGTLGDFGDGGPATDARLGDVTGVAIDGAGNLFIAYYNRVRRVSPDGIITTVAGPGPPRPNSNCSAGPSGDGGPATQASLCVAYNVAVDRVGNLFILELGYDTGDYTNVVVRKVSPDGIITTVAGDGLGLSWAGQVALDGAGNLFIADGASVRKVSSEGIVTTVAGFGACCYSGDGGPATSAQLNLPHGVGVDGAGNLFIADHYNHRIRRVSPDGIITTVAGGTLSVRCLDLSGESGPAAGAQLCAPFNIAVDGAGNVFIADYYRVRKVSPGGTITAVAGNGAQGYSGEGGLATDAQLSYAYSVAADRRGNLFFQDLFRIRKVSPDGIINTIAGNGTYGDSGDGGPAINAQIKGGSSALAADGAGNLFFLDSGRIRKVSSDGIITTVAGGGKDFPGDGGPATSAQLKSPSGLAVDGAGSLFISDAGRIRKVSPDGIITTVAGGGPNASSDGGLATDAQPLYLSSLVVDGEGNIYGAESASNTVLILRPINSPF